MQAIQRVNPRGDKYTLIPKGQNWTEIYCHRNKKEIRVNTNIEQMNQAWELWVDKEWMIQGAFAFLNADERKFLMTGITAEEWDEIFSESLGDA